ncbi:MAG: hypothetical protein KAW39_01255 [Thermoplasmata archaeon]|nr:hypothetical protein [Thermoplasmata archaeon]
MRKRGPLCYIGKTGNPIDESVQAQKRAFAASMILFGVVSLLMALWATGHIHLRDQTYDFVLVAGIAVLMIAFLGYGLSLGFEVDAIYGNGITNRDTTLIDRIRGRTFTSFADIKTIRLITTERIDGVLESLEIVGDRGPLLRRFHNREYINDFYSNLVREIRTKCPDCVWEEVETVGRRR